MLPLFIVSSFSSPKTNFSTAGKIFLGFPNQHHSLKSRNYSSKGTMILKLTRKELFSYCSKNKPYIKR